MNKIRVAKAGMFTTVQDRGRLGLRQFGVVASGAMDLVSHELANVLVGNDADVATLEMTCSGDTLELPADTLISICGAAVNPQFVVGDRRSLAVPQNRPVLIHESGFLRVGNASAGFRAYLAVAGGIDVPIVMGSRSTYLRAKVGGYAGRKLVTGDVLTIASPFAQSKFIRQRLIQASVSRREMNEFSVTRWFTRPVHLPVGELVELRSIRGTHRDWLNKQSLDLLYNTEFEVSSSSDRMGYRLVGAKLECAARHELLSEGITIGTVQLPADGNPILIMSDGAPTGGYPRIAHVAAVDLPIAAQLRPGQRIRFREVSIDEAQDQFRAQRKLLDQIKNTVAHWASGALP